MSTNVVISSASRDSIAANPNVSHVLEFEARTVQANKFKIDTSQCSFLSVPGSAHAKGQIADWFVLCWLNGKRNSE